MLPLTRLRISPDPAGFAVNAAPVRRDVAGFGGHHAVQIRDGTDPELGEARRIAKALERYGETNRPVPTHRHNSYGKLSR